MSYLEKMTWDKAEFILCRNFKEVSAPRQSWYEDIVLTRRRQWVTPAWLKLHRLSESMMAEPVLKAVANKIQVCKSYIYLKNIAIKISKTLKKHKKKLLYYKPTKKEL